MNKNRQWIKRQIETLIKDCICMKNGNEIKFNDIYKTYNPKMRFSERETISEKHLFITSQQILFNVLEYFVSSSKCILAQECIG